MRPLRLRMTAFGPYRQQEEIDFTQLGDRRLFVISGMTGSGKTTIFDAITYALYGSASGEDRADFRLLRSHFADENTHTSVDFSFAAGKRTYRVFRQMAHRKGNNKHETGAKVELYETTSGEEVPCARFTVSDVNAKIESIIGLTREQFIQIVMLPQGEFRKLLTSDTENKEEILRRIFRTERYQKLEEKFYEKSRRLREEVQEAASRLQVHMQHAADSFPLREDSALAATLQQDVYSPRQLIEGIKQEQAYYTAQVETLQLQQEEESQRLARIEQEYRAAEELNLKFEQRERLRGRIEELRSRDEEMAELERRLTMADLAARITPYEDHAAMAARDVQAKEQMRQAQEQSLAKLELERQAAEHAYKLEEDRAEERKQLELELNRMRELLPSVQRLGKLKREADRLQAEKSSLESQLAELENQITRMRTAKQELDGQVQRLEEETSQLPAHERELERLRHKARTLKELIQLEQQMAEYEKQEKAGQEKLAEIRREHDRMEAAWIEGQAGLLALHLQDGKPCPVCGSLDHPRKAVQQEDLMSREALMQLKEQLRQAEQEVHAAAAQVAAARGTWQNRAELFDEYGIAPQGLEEQLQAVIAEGKELSSKTEQLRNKTQQLGELRRQRQGMEQQLEHQQRERDGIAVRLQEIALQYSKQHALWESEWQRIPENMRDPVQVEKGIAALEKRLQERLTAWQQAQVRLQEAEKRQVEAAAQLASLEKQLAEARDKEAQAQQRFAEELAKAGFAGADAYRQAKMPEAERKAGLEQLQEHRRNLMLLQGQLSELDQALQGREPIELGALEQGIAEAKQRLEAISYARQDAQRYAEEAVKWAATIDQAAARTSELEREHGKVQELYQMIKGDNPRRMSFERYILIDYLEQILHAANVRLEQLSNGQYRLIRSDRLEARGRQSGLGLDVYDAYTGQNRDVKSLSGGEKFNASLALALGMTDVIQSHQGGVSIEMMFIDEGFGSLDEEALHKAIAALIDLQAAGRMIGVISHVAELKEAFPAVLEVTKTKEGCSRTKLILK